MSSQTSFHIKLIVTNHTSTSSPWTDSLCDLRFILDWIALSHFLQVNLFPPCTDSLCILRYPLWLNTVLHVLQITLISCMNKIVGVFTGYLKKTEIGITYLANKYIPSVDRIFVRSQVTWWNISCTDLQCKVRLKLVAGLQSHWSHLNIASTSL